MNAERAFFIQYPDRKRGNAWFQDLRWRLWKMQGAARDLLTDEFASSAGVRDSKAVFGALVVGLCLFSAVVGFALAVALR